VMREYDQRFVYRRVFASRVDRGTQTNEGEFPTGGPELRREFCSIGPKVRRKGLFLSRARPGGSSRPGDESFNKADADD